MRIIEYGVILAAGEATRLKPLSDYFPKLILPILNKPLLVHHFDIMEIIGVKKVFIIVSPSNLEMTETILMRHKTHRIDYEFVVQRLTKGTGHALSLLEEKLNDQQFFLLLGDEYYSDIESFKTFNEDTSDNFRMGIVEYQDIKEIRKGCNVHLAEDYVIKLVEKPSIYEIEGKWCWDGSILLDSMIFNAIRKSILLKGKTNNLCITDALQILLNCQQKIGIIKKDCININITTNIDFVFANIIELKKKYGDIELVE